MFIYINYNYIIISIPYDICIYINIYQSLTPSFYVILLKAMPVNREKDIKVGGLLKKKGFSRRKEGLDKDKRGCVKIPKTQHIHVSYCQRILEGFFVFCLFVFKIRSFY